MESLLSSCDCTVGDGEWAVVACSGTLYTYVKWRLRRRGKNKRGGGDLRRGKNKGQGRLAAGRGGGEGRGRCIHNA